MYGEHNLQNIIDIFGIAYAVKVIQVKDCLVRIDIVYKSWISSISRKRKPIESYNEAPRKKLQQHTVDMLIDVQFTFIGFNVSEEMENFSSLMKLE